jgi:hypothetical protein
VPILFFVNTVGASLGAYFSSAWLLPTFGQQTSLMTAVACNGGASILVAWLAKSKNVVPARSKVDSVARWISKDEALGGVLGLVALGYEMALFRVLTLTHQPLPTTFATGLAAYLLAWSVGVALAARLPMGVAAPALISAVAVLLVPVSYDHQIATQSWPLMLAVAVYTLPCVGFGLLYGQLVSRSARRWGRDVGRYAAVNTLGSCAGILFFTLVGYDVPQGYVFDALVLALVAVAIFELVSGHSKLDFVAKASRASTSSSPRSD